MALTYYSWQGAVNASAIFSPYHDPIAKALHFDVAEEALAPGEKAACDRLGRRSGIPSGWRSRQFHRALRPRAVGAGAPTLKQASMPRPCPLDPPGAGLASGPSRSHPEGSRGATAGPSCPI